MKVKRATHTLTIMYRHLVKIYILLSIQAESLGKYKKPTLLGNKAIENTPGVDPARGSRSLGPCQTKYQ